MRWWCILCVSVLWRTVSSKAVLEVDNEPEASNTRRCCPCPEESDIQHTPLADQAFNGNLRTLAYPDLEAFGTSGSGARTSLVNVDDCPCRFRDADSAGSASMFFPSAMRAIRPLVSLHDEKEESKPLLHPEVHLASSVLETLREATDEEYEEALARDAARSVARSMEPNAIAEGARNFVSVLVNPKQNSDDDEVATTSPIKETRFIQPSLEKTNSPGIPTLNPPELLTIFKNPARKSALKNSFNKDSDVGASNINENVVSVSHYDKINLKPNMDLLNILSDKNYLKNNQINVPKLSDILKNIEETVSLNSLSSKKLDSGIIGNKITLPSILDVKTKTNSDNHSKRDKMDEIVNLDNINSPSKIIERYSEYKSSEDNNKHIEGIPGILTDIKKNLLETKIPQLRLIPETRDATTDLMTNIMKTLEDSRSLLPLNLFNTRRETTSAANTDSENKEDHITVSTSNDNQKHSTEIIDTVPSSSIINVNAQECVNNMKDESKSDEIYSIDPNATTEILDSVPSISDSNEVINTNAVPDSEALDLSENPAISDSHTNIALKEDGSSENNSLGSDIRENVKLENENCSENSNLSYDDSNKAGSGDIAVRSENFEHPSLTSSEDDSKPLETLSIEDLQQMSNSLLDQEKNLINALVERNKITGTVNAKSDDNVKIPGDLEAEDTSIFQPNTENQITSKTENVCLSDTSPLKNSDSITDGTKPSEMISDASETVGSIIKPVSFPKSSLLPKTVQSSLFDESNNLFNIPRISLPDIFSNSMPTLGLHNNFGERNGINNLWANDEIVSKRGMSSLASTSNSKSILAPLQPLEDMNLDILQLKPLDLSQSSSLPILPRLNLNSYKAKLAIPKSLPVKPVVLESSVTNKKGIIGALMSFGKETDNGLKYNPSNTATDILGNPIVLPTFDDLKENFLENAQNLLSTPLETTGRNIIEDTFRSGQVLSENLKVQAKNVVNDLEKNLQFSLRGAKLGDSIKHSELLDEISRRHEDLGDKLKGIHSDFSDRLETLRNNILDQIPNLNPQMARQSSNTKMSEQSLRFSSKSRKNKAPIGNKKSKKSQKSLKMLPSPSLITPKFAENTVSNTSYLELSSLIPTPKDRTTMSQFKSKTTPFFNKNSPLRKPLFKPKLKENKVKITFETTPRPVLKLNSSITSSKPKYSNKILVPKGLSQQNNLKSKSLTLKSVDEPSESLSKVKAIDTKTPLRVSIRPKSLPRPLHEMSRLASNPESSVVNNPLSLKSIAANRQKASGKSLIENKMLKTELSPDKSPSWPRIIDDTFLVKVREALKARLAGFPKHQQTLKLSKTEPFSLDMEKSASNTMEIVSPTSDLMKENTSYSCQMRCTKN